MKVNETNKVGCKIIITKKANGMFETQREGGVVEEMPQLLADYFVDWCKCHGTSNKEMKTILQIAMNKESLTYNCCEDCRYYDGDSFDGLCDLPYEETIDTKARDEGTYTCSFDTACEKFKLKDR